jgi:bifunctional DNase/RNase
MEPKVARIHGVFMASGTGGSAPVVILDLGEDSFIPIFIGFFEALSISQAVNQNTSPRPLTHDLVVDLINRFSVKVVRVYIDALEDGVYYGDLVLDRNGHEEHLDCRPSDGIAIAVRTGAEILVDPALAVIAGVSKETLPHLMDLTAFLHAQ